MRETRKQSEIQDNNNNKHKSVAANRNRYSTISWIKQQKQQQQKHTSERRHKILVYTK